MGYAKGHTGSYGGSAERVSQGGATAEHAVGRRGSARGLGTLWGTSLGGPEGSSILRPALRSVTCCEDMPQDTAVVRTGHLREL